MNSKGIKDLLKEAGLLIYHQQKGPIALNTNTNTFKISSKSSFKSYSENNNESDQQFCTSQIIKSRIVISKRDFFQKRKELSSKY